MTKLLSILRSFSLNIIKGWLKMTHEEIKKVIPSNPGKKGNFEKKSNGRDIEYIKPKKPNTPPIPIKPSKSDE